jgi:hypothetical protein
VAQITAASLGPVKKLRHIYAVMLQQFFHGPNRMTGPHGFARERLLKNIYNAVGGTFYDAIILGKIKTVGDIHVYRNQREKRGSYIENHFH